MSTERAFASPIGSAVCQLLIDLRSAFRMSITAACISGTPPVFQALYLRVSVPSRALCKPQEESTKQYEPTRPKEFHQYSAGSPCSSSSPLSVRALSNCELSKSFSVH